MNLTTTNMTTLIFIALDSFLLGFLVCLLTLTRKALDGWNEADELLKEVSRALDESLKH